MPVKIRLTRHGKKRKPYYHIVIADGRAPRDGRFIERIGMYNPNTNPATIEIDFDKALDWLQKGAQPTETCRAILSYKGILYKNHLLGGVKKGAFSEEEAEKRFQAWMKEKESKIQAKKDGLKLAFETEQKKKLDAETKINEARALEIAKRNAKLEEEAAGENKEPAAKTDNVAKDAEQASQTEPQVTPEEKVEAKEESGAAEAGVEAPTPEKQQEPVTDPQAEPKAEASDEKAEQTPSEEVKEPAKPEAAEKDSGKKPDDKNNGEKEK